MVVWRMWIISTGLLSCLLLSGKSGNVAFFYSGLSSFCCCPIVLGSLSKIVSSLYVSGLSLLVGFLEVHLKFFPYFLIGLVWAISTKVKRFFVILGQFHTSEALDRDLRAARLFECFLDNASCHQWFLLYAHGPHSDNHFHHEVSLDGGDVAIAACHKCFWHL